MDDNLKVVVRYFKQIGCGPERPNTEFEALSGLGRRIVEKHRPAIDQYFKTAPPATEEELEAIDAKLRAYLFSKTKLTCFKDILSVLCGYLLVYRGDSFDHVTKLDTIVNLGKSYADVLLRVLSRKDYSAGVPIHSSNASLVNLKKRGTKQAVIRKYFKINDKYYAGSRSKRYTLTDKSEALLLELEQVLYDNFLEYVHQLGKHMEGTVPKSPSLLVDDYGNYVINPTPIPPLPVPFLNTFRGSPTICLPAECTSILKKHFLYLSVNDLAQLSLPSLLHVMGVAFLGQDGQTIIVPLKNLSSTDPSLGRHYNIFTRLRSAERKALGYINYDISGGIQIISFGILFKYSAHLYAEADNLVGAYPMIFHYGYDPKYKKKLRRLLAKQLGISTGEVKAMLTAFANGSKKSTGNNKLLRQFRDESDLLRREVISVVETNEPELRKKAEQQSKHTFPDDMDWENTMVDDKHAREKSSVFFFIWTYYEKQIRDAMLSVVDDGIPVHDAIYSKHKLPFHVFTDAIEKQTGFQVHVTH